MKAAQLHTAVWKGIEYTLPIRQWGVKVQRSASFLSKHLKLCEAEGMPRDKRMQYAIEKKSDYGACGSQTRKTKQLKESTRQRIENEAVKKVQNYLSSIARPHHEA